MIYIIHKMLVLIKNNLNSIMETLGLKEENIIKDIRNLFRLKQELNYTAIKDIRKLLEKKKKLYQLKMEYLEILRVLLRMKMKKKIIINQ